MTGACMGRCIDTDLLAEVLASDPATTRLALEDLAGMGLLSALEAEEPLDPSPPREYVFAHDRIQQAAYLLLAPPDRMAIHARAGRLLKPMLPSSAGPEGLFSLCNHLNQGLPLLTEEERAELAQLNLRAAAQARRATDYDMALGFLDHARSLLPEDLWTADEQSAVDFALIRSACHYLKGNFVEVERILQEWRTRATGAVNRAKAHSELMVLYENLNRFDETIAQGNAGLALLGESLPLHPRPGHVFLELAKVLAASLGKHPHDWADHTTQTDVRGQAALQLLVTLFASALRK
jgi:predicted ATPase